MLMFTGLSKIRNFFLTFVKYGGEVDFLEKVFDFVYHSRLFMKVWPWVPEFYEVISLSYTNTDSSNLISYNINNRALFQSLITVKHGYNVLPGRGNFASLYVWFVISFKFTTYYIVKGKRQFIINMFAFTVFYCTELQIECVALISCNSSSGTCISWFYSLWLSSFFTVDS